MGRHQFDAGSFAAGLLFLAIAGVYFAGGLSGRPLIRLEFLAPAMLIGLGVIGLIKVLTRARRQNR